MSKNLSKNLSSSSVIERTTSRRTFTKAVVLVSVVGVLAAEAPLFKSAFAHVQALPPTVVQQPQTQTLLPRTDAFVFSTTNKLYHKYYFNGWSAWLNVNPDDTISFAGDQPAVAVVQQTLHVFAQDDGGNIVWMWSSDGQWSNWTLLGAPSGSGSLSSLAVTTQGDGSLDLFALASNAIPDPQTGEKLPADLFHRQWINSQWSDWENLGNSLSASVSINDKSMAVSSWGPGSLDVFVVGGDEAVWHQSFDNGQWLAWESLGGSVLQGLAAVSWGPGRIDVIACGKLDDVWHKWYDNSQWSGDLGGTNWESWEEQSLGDLAASAPALSSWGPGRLDVYVDGMDASLLHKWYDNGQWSSGPDTGEVWESLSNPPVSSLGSSGPASVSWLVPIQLTPTPIPPTPTPTPRPTPTRTIVCHPTQHILCP